MTGIDPAALDALRAWDTPTRGGDPRRGACSGFDVDVLKRAMADSAEIHRAPASGSGSAGSGT